jgi:outer membrane protein assembly factor BamE (lipoprotein component of BamABCDE complex)
MGMFKGNVNRRLVANGSGTSEAMTRNHNPHRLAFIAGVVTLTLGGCSVPVDQRGNLPNPTTLADIKPGVSDKATVTRLLGSPSSVAAFDKDTWYYISQKTKEVAFFKPELLDQEVVVINFDQDGVVRDVRHRGMEDRKVVVPDPNATPAPGREFSFLEQLIGNFGRFAGGGAPAAGGGASGPPSGGGGYP